MDLPEKDSSTSRHAMRMLQQAFFAHYSTVFFLFPSEFPALLEQTPNKLWHSSRIPRNASTEDCFSYELFRDMLNPDTNPTVLIASRARKGFLNYIASISLITFKFSEEVIKNVLMDITLN